MYEKALTCVRTHNGERFFRHNRIASRINLKSIFFYFSFGCT